MLKTVIAISFLTIPIVTMAKDVYKGIKLITQKKKNQFILWCDDVSFNMRLSPHLLVGGLSGQGKTKFVESLFLNRDDVDIYLLNAFKEDFKGINCVRINNVNDILILLSDITKGKLEGIYRNSQSQPAYIIVDELLELSIRDKRITKELTKLLAVARHYNIYVIAIAQQATKEEIQCKSLFNCRVSFKQVEYSSYQTILGYSPEDKHIKQREFYFRNSEGTGFSKVPVV